MAIMSSMTIAIKIHGRCLGFIDSASLVAAYQ